MFYLPDTIIITHFKIDADPYIVNLGFLTLQSFQ